MELTIFAKKRYTKEGKPFTTYITRLTKKDGSTVSASVKFRDRVPELFPTNIVIKKSDANMSSRHYTDSVTGEVKESYTLWVTDWTAGSEFVDHSLDDFEI